MIMGERETARGILEESADSAETWLPARSTSSRCLNKSRSSQNPLNTASGLAEASATGHACREIKLRALLRRRAVDITRRHDRRSLSDGR